MKKGGVLALQKLAEAEKDLDGEIKIQRFLPRLHPQERGEGLNGCKEGVKFHSRRSVRGNIVLNFYHVHNNKLMIHKLLDEIKNLLF
jgi:hypothetical protein